MCFFIVLMFNVLAHVLCVMFINKEVTTSSFLFVSKNNNNNNITKTETKVGSDHFFLEVCVELLLQQ